MSKLDPQSRLSAIKFQNIFFACLSIYLRENKEASFLLFWIFKLKQPNNQNYYWLWVFFGILVSNCQICITFLNYTVDQSHAFFSELELAMRRSSPKKASTKLSVKKPSNPYHCPKKDQTQQKIPKISTLEVWQVLADWKVMWNGWVLLRDLLRLLAPQPLKRKKLKVRDDHLITTIFSVF